MKMHAQKRPCMPKLVKPLDSIMPAAKKPKTSTFGETDDDNKTNNIGDIDFKKLVPCPDSSSGDFMVRVQSKLSDGQKALKLTVLPGVSEETKELATDTIETLQFIPQAGQAPTEQVLLSKNIMNPASATTNNLAVLQMQRLKNGTEKPLKDDTEKIQSCPKVVKKRCWKCNGKVEVVGKYYLNLRHEWGIKPRTNTKAERWNDIAISCDTCSSFEEMDNPKSSQLDDDKIDDCNLPLKEPRSCQPCRLIYFGIGQHICPPTTQECPTCGQMFSSWIRYEYHMNKEKGVAPFKCEYCDYATFSPFMLSTSHLARDLCPGYRTKASV